MNKQEIYDYLKEKNIWYEITEHKAVYNMEDQKILTYHIQKQMEKIYLLEMIKKEIITL